MPTTSIINEKNNLPKKTVNYEKALGVSTMSSTLSLRQKRTANAIINIVKESFFLRNPELATIPIPDITQSHVENTNTTYNIPEEYFMKMLGFEAKDKYYSYTQILKALKDLSNETIVFDALGHAKNSGEEIESAYDSFTKIISSASRDKGYFKINVPPILIHKVICSRLKFNALVDWSKLTSKFTPELLELCQYTYQKGGECTDWIEVDKLKKLTGSKITEAWRFKQKCLNVAIKDINSQPDTGISVEIEGAALGGKKGIGQPPITHYRFNVTEKLALENQQKEASNFVTLQTFKTELRALGIAQNQVEGVLDECRINECGDIELAYLGWIVSKGNELRSLKKHKILDTNKFGGVFRNEIVRGKKKEWFEIQNLIKNHLLQNEHSLKIDNRFYKKYRKVLIDNIIRDHLTSVNEHAFTYLNENYENFYKENFPADYDNYKTDSTVTVITSLEGFDYHVLELFFDFVENLLTAKAFAHQLSKCGDMRQIIQKELLFNSDYSLY